MRPAALAAPALSVAAGLSLLASHPPVGAWPLTFLAPGLLLAALWTAGDRDRPPRSGTAALLGTLAGAVAFFPLLSWLILPAGLVGWGLLAGIQALWVGLLAVLVAPFVHRWWAPAVVATVWTGIDAWRALVPLSGFEWGAIAYAHVEGSWLLPVARLVGGRGITWLVVLVSAAAAVVIRRAVATVREREGGPVDVRLDRSTRGPVALLVGGLLVSALATVEPPAEQGSIDVLVAQGNDVRHWEDGVVDPDPPTRITTALRDLTVDAVARDGRPDLTIWPESSIDREPTRGRGLELAALADEAAAAAGTLLTGASLDGPDPATQREIAALLLQDGFTETDRYVKRRLVPFGEFVPFRPLLDWYPALDQIPRDAVPGAGPQALEIAPGVRAAVIICFETLFPQIVRSNLQADGELAQVLLTLTNDASFGDSAEPAQHLAQSRLRAVETGRYVVHAALTGASAIVAPDGSVSHETPVFELATIRAEVPLVEGATPYLVIGEVLPWTVRVATVLVALLLAVGAIRTRTRAGRAGR